MTKWPLPITTDGDKRWAVHCLVLCPLTAAHVAVRVSRTSRKAGNRAAWRSCLSPAARTSNHRPAGPHSQHAPRLVSSVGVWAVRCELPITSVIRRFLLAGLTRGRVRPLKGPRRRQFGPWCVPTNFTMSSYPVRYASAREGFSSFPSGVSLQPAAPYGIKEVPGRGSGKPAV